MDCSKVDWSAMSMASLKDELKDGKTVEMMVD